MATYKVTTGLHGTVTSIKVKAAKRWTRNGICDHDMMTSVLLRVILDIQDNMKNGDAVKRIPPLDPLNISRLEFDIKINKNHKYGIKGELRNVVAEGMSTFKVTDIKSDMMEMEANVSLLIDTLRLFGDYDMRGKIARIFPISGNGTFFLQPKQLQVAVFTKLRYSKEGQLEISHFDFHVNVTDIFVKFNGFRGAWKIISRGINKILNSFGLAIFNKLEPRLHDRIRQRTINEINMKLLDWKFNETVMMEMLQIPIRCLFG
ncbi:uncharacterized protein LOC110847733 isoform X2 [Folsomia candida]|uniref:Protein takeout n=1 Tax=Folsomia candida TaxID=158441 RepID=A0A226EKR5_FOLCA|nr:uncharacterized protein LOC110847733 isoform X2 [Folsomia candida]OXA58232.1 hypothetical protein Fcan01_06592 [Folsomia candida]